MTEVVHVKVKYVTLAWFTAWAGLTTGTHHCTRARHT